MTFRKLVILGLTAGALVASVAAMAQQAAPPPTEPAKAGDAAKQKADAAAERKQAEAQQKAEAGKAKSAKAAAARKAVAGQDEPEEEDR